MKQKLDFCVASNTGRQKVRKKMRQKFSVIITNSCGFLVFKTKRELKCQNEPFFWYHQKCLFWLLRISDNFFDTLIDDTIWRCTKLQLKCFLLKRWRHACHGGLLTRKLGLSEQIQRKFWYFLIGIMPSRHKWAYL